MAGAPSGCAAGHGAGDLDVPVRLHAGTIRARRAGFQTLMQKAGAYAGTTPLLRRVPGSPACASPGAALSAKCHPPAPRRSHPRPARTIIANPLRAGPAPSESASNCASATSRFAKVQCKRSSSPYYRCGRRQHATARKFLPSLASTAARSMPRKTRRALASGGRRRLGAQGLEACQFARATPQLFFHRDDSDGGFFAQLIQPLNEPAARSQSPVDFG